MKKLNKITAALASLALVVAAFTGCPSSNPDLEAVGDLSGFYIRGALYEDGWNILTEDNLLVADTDKGEVGFYYATFKALGTSGAWKIANSDWTSQYNQNAGNMTIGSLPDGVTDEPVDDGNGGFNECFVGLTEGQWYKINVIASATSVEVSMEETTAEEETTIVPYYFDGLYLVGSVFGINSGTTAWGFTSENLIFGASVDSSTGYVTYTKDITATAASGELGINDSDWANMVCVKGTELTPDGEAVLVSGDGTKGNCAISGLTASTPYRITITTTPDKEIYIAVEEICSYTLTFEITGLNEGELAWLNGSCWGSAWPCGWALSTWGGTGSGFDVSDAAVADADGVATFDSSVWDVTNVCKPGETLSFALKFIASDNNWATTLYDNANISFDIEDVSAGTYKISVDSQENEVTVTKL